MIELMIKQVKQTIKINLYYTQSIVKYSKITSNKNKKEVIMLMNAHNY